MSEFTAHQKIECVRREIRQREYVYGRRVADGKMTQRKADEEIALMRAIEADYEKLASAERLI